MTPRGRLFAVLLALAASGCDAGTDHPTPAPIRAEFGILFGGQVQQRQRIPLETDRSKQTVGFRLTFGAAVSRSQRIEWQLDLPGTSRNAPDHRGRLGEGRLTRLGEAQTRAGEPRFEQVIELLPGDPLGTWNVRVLVDGNIVLDRPFLMVRADR